MFNVAMQTVTLRLPEAVLRRAQDAATAQDRPIEVALAKLVAASFQGVDDAPPEMQPELTRMAWLSNRELRKIAGEEMPISHQAKMQELAALQTARRLTRSEQAALKALRHEYGQTVLRKAHAYAILSVRSGRGLLAN